MIEDGCIAADLVEHTMRTASVTRHDMCNQFARSLQQSKIIPVNSQAKISDGVTRIERDSIRKAVKII